jgi:uncharacterized protein (TIGR02145 family)
MKKTSFFLAMLASVAASAQVTHVELVGANYATQTVLFRIWWNAGSRNATHLSKVWVWVDYIQINANNTTSGNTWTRATIGTVSGGASSFDGSNRNGFWLEGNASTNYSATLTVKLTNVPAKFNWCAYVSDYPPNVTANNGTYTFKGTPPFTLIASNGTTSQTVTGKTLAVSALTITPTTIRDKTECPGDFCIYKGSDLFIDGTHLCQQRTSGAKNWEAWIKDSRDQKLYRIVLMPDNKWWLAQNVKYASKGSQPSWCGEDECGRVYTAAEMRNGQSSTGNITGICPSGWLTPIVADWSTLVSAVNAKGVKASTLAYINHGCSETDYFGWADIKNVYSGTAGLCECVGDTNRMSSKMANDATVPGRGISFMCSMSDGARVNSTAAAILGSPVRCFLSL